MARPKKALKSAEDKLRDQLAEVRHALQTKDQVIAAQQAEIEDMRGMVVELQAPKPGRAFRARKLIHGPLDITIKGVDVTEEEVFIEHVGGFLSVSLVSYQVNSETGERDAYMAVRNRRGGQLERGDVVYSLPAPPPMRPTESIQARELRSVGISDLSAVDVHGLNDGDPTVVNAAMAPQADPRMPGAQQYAPESGIVSRYGWTGTGPKPRGWVDADVPKPDAAN